MAKFETTGLTPPVYAFPGSEVNFANWASLRVEATSALGRDIHDVDETISDLWYVFEGSAVPTGWEDNVAVVDVSEPGATVGDVQQVAQDIIAHGGGGPWASPLTQQDVQQFRYRLGTNGDSQQPDPPTVPPILIPPSDVPGTSNGVALCVKSGSATSGVRVNLVMLKEPDGAGYVFVSPVESKLSANNGQVLFENLIIGARYRAWAGTSRTPTRFTDFIVPNNPSFQVPNIIVG